MITNSNSSKGENTISSIDADGISLVSIKALTQRDINNKKRISQLENTVLALLERLEKLEKG